MEVTKSYLINRVADLVPCECVLNELKSWLLARSNFSKINDYSFCYTIVLDKIRQLELKYKGVKE